MTIVCIIVYDRFDNIKRWVECWKQSEHYGAELIVIHNHYGDINLIKRFKALCDAHRIIYIGRNNKGFDIGAFQDVCKERLPGFNNKWDKLLWCCDDTMPMQKDFLKSYMTKLTGKVVVACMEISNYPKKHIRTSGFMISKEFSKKIEFEVDPISTKEDCYRFEHRHINSFYEQAIKVGEVIQVAPNEVSPLWDKGYKKGLKREAEHIKTFDLSKKVVFICPVFDAFPEIISSLICQTHNNWELLLICDNPETEKITKALSAWNDNRITYIHKDRVGNWGHPLRQWALEEIKEGRLAKDANYIVIGNADNYHVPSFCEKMIAGFTNGEAATYCSSMVHNYISWGVIQCKLVRGYIDCAGVMVTKEAACSVGWRDVNSHSADWVYFSDIIKKYGINKFKSVPGCLLVHN